ncbi:hypothetical protein HPB50_014541 [Hyalomma asiaticum]|uniref:Uncharacterized protein n=1 Tax=Hyalomma asiaticum TaxID=266040 RepID=A0ACB7SEM5_HYAAI|nr:hypothetical protein HPB50_014541 [Hyalomma asiaticum]
MPERRQRAPRRDGSDCRRPIIEAARVMFALGMQLLLWLLFVAFLLLASLVVAVLGAVHVARRATWKRLARFPGPNEDVPLRWVVQQHVHATSVKHRTPYNVCECFELDRLAICRTSSLPDTTTPLCFVSRHRRSLSKIATCC